MRQEGGGYYKTPLQFNANWHIELILSQLFLF